MRWLRRLFGAGKPAPEIARFGLQEMSLRVAKAKNGMVVLRFSYALSDEELILCLPRAGGLMLLDQLIDALAEETQTVQ